MCSQTHALYLQRQSCIGLIPRILPPSSKRLKFRNRPRPISVAVMIEGGVWAAVERSPECAYATDYLTPSTMAYPLVSTFVSDL